VLGKLGYTDGGREIWLNDTTVFVFRLPRPEVTRRKAPLLMTKFPLAQMDEYLATMESALTKFVTLENRAPKFRRP
jgi:hypothetical protein